MAKVPVYRFSLFDALRGTWVLQQGYATRAYIEAAEGCVMFNTKVPVDESFLEPDGTCPLPRRALVAGN